MLVAIPDVLNADQLAAINEALLSRDGAGVDGRVSAGHQGAQVKRNMQLQEGSPDALRFGDMILASVERNPRFISAALPNRVYPPMFNRYETGMQFGNHVDGAVRIIPSTGAKIRNDLSVTLFLNGPDTYDGGELLIEDTFGVHEVKLPAGHMIVYPASSLHKVSPITRGTRFASFFWVQSLVRDDAQRTLLFDLDNAIQRLGATGADEMARTHLASCYHNLLRMWTDV
jgi:PKHD-type hydroxylase